MFLPIWKLDKEMKQDCFFLLLYIGKRLPFQFNEIYASSVTAALLFFRIQMICIQRLFCQALGFSQTPTEPDRQTDRQRVSVASDCMRWAFNDVCVFSVFVLRAFCAGHWAPENRNVGAQFSIGASSVASEWLWRRR